MIWYQYCGKVLHRLFHIKQITCQNKCIHHGLALGMIQLWVKWLYPAAVWSAWHRTNSITFALDRWNAHLTATIRRNSFVTIWILSVGANWYTCVLSTGEEVGFYFAWMKFYSMFILLPALVGFLMYVLRPGDISVDNDPYLPFYSMFIAIWGVLFLRVSACGGVGWWEMCVGCFDMLGEGI